MSKTPQKESIAERTRGYIDAHPSIKDCISKELMNYSSLARQIGKDLGISNEEAIMIACRRYASKLGKHDHESKILDILKKSRLEMKTKICIITAKNDWTVLHRLEVVFKKLLNEKSTMQVIQSTHAITIIADEKLRGEIIKAVGNDNVLRVKEDLVEIAVKSPEDIVKTSGVFAYLSSSLAEGGLNLVETVSCHTDTIFIVSEEDMIEAYSILSDCIESAEEMSSKKFS